MNEKIIIKAQIQQMADSDIIDMIPVDTMNRIKTNDPNPEFRVFSIGHEGDANANVVGSGMRVLRYAKDLIVQMFNRVRLGLQVFNRHNPASNQHDGREEVGEVVGKTLKEIGGKLHSLAAVYVRPEARKNNFDIASIEGNFEAEERADGSMGVVNLSQITGIALSHHSIDTPGMPGATLQAALQMFHGRFHQMAKLTKEEIKAAIAESGVKIMDLFSESEILELEPVKKNKQTEYEWAKRIEKKLGEAHEENAKLQGSITKMSGELTTLKEKANAGTVKDVVGKIATERKLDPKFTKYIEENVGVFKSDKEGDDYKKAVGDFVDAQAAKYKEMGKLYGFEAKITVDGKTEEGAEGKEKNNSGAPSSDQAAAAAGKVSEDALDPKKNDFIPA